MSIISKDISKAVSLLQAEELVAIPTETVYGLAGNIFSEKAINAIFSTKKRPHFNPLIVHIPHIEYLHTIVESLPKKAEQLAKAFWPGPLTLVLKKKAIIPDLITAGKDTVAVRIPNHKTTLELLKHIDFPLAAPSANPFNRISPTTAKHVEDYFKKDIKMVLDGGNCNNGIESTIIGFENDEPILYRLGSTTIEAIEKVVGTITIKNKSNDAPLAPGMLAKHYAPKTRTILVEDVEAALKNNSNKKIALLTYYKTYTNSIIQTQVVLSANKNLEEAASNLYNALHKLDQESIQLIIAERFPEKGLGKTINDRLYRATK